MRLKKKILCAALCMCMVCTLAGVAGIQANADSVPAGFSFNVKLAGDSAYKYYDGSDTDSLSVSSMNSGSGSYSGGTITATNAGGSSTIHLRESKNFKNAEYILVPFTMSVEVPAYTAYTVDTKIQLSMNRNAKGASWYVFEWTDNTNDAAYSKRFSTKMDLTTTEGFVYRAYGNDKTYNPTEEGTLVFDNRTGDTATTITRQYAIFAGNSRSASLLKSYHHQLETSLTLTPTAVTATKVITYYNEDTFVGSQQYSDNSKALFSTVPSKTGYVFTGWLGSDGNTYQPGTTYNGSTGLKLTAQWKEGKSTVTFDANEGTVGTASREVCVDSTYGELPTPVRDYYTFLGWYTGKTGGSRVTKDTVVTKTENHTLYAHWMNKTAYVKFDPNGGSPSSSVTMNAGTKLSNIPGFATNPTRTNYTFAGWYTAKDGGIQVTGDTIISDSVTYYAHWTGKESTVTLEYNDGSTNDGTINVNYGGTYSNLPTPERTNYTFNGWYTTESGGSRVTDSTTVTAKANHTLYARWTRNTANIQFMDGDSTIASRTVNAGDKLGELPQPAKTGYTFDGWYTSENGGNKVTADTKITEAANYYAHWTAKTYTVTFDKNDGTAGESSSETKSLEYGSNYKLPAAPERTGYTFIGWFTAASGGTEVTEQTAVARAENHTLYAQWERVVYTVTFKNGTSTVETRRINAGDSLGTLPTVTKTGYTLEGWYTSENGGTKVNDTDTISNDVTYYAQWTANQYTITFNPNGGTVTDGTKTLEYGNKLTLPANPTRTGYTFEGWYTAATGGTKVETTRDVPSADTTYYAHWTANQYTVTFNANGGTLSGSSSASVAYGSTYGTLPTATKTNQNFVGWYTAASGGTQVSANTVMNRTEAHTLYAHWETQHKHAVAPDGTAVVFDKVLTQSYINGLTSETISIGTATVNYITLTAGNYYLTENITTDKSIWLTGNVNICFNGHTITSTFSRNDNNVAAMIPNNSCHFAACDCQGDGGFTCENGYVLTTANRTNCTVELYGGMFSGGWTTYVTNSNSLTVDGATIKATGIAINAQSNSKVTIKSGLVTSDISKLSNSNWAAMYVYSGVECKIEGGTITNTNESRGYSISVGESCIKLSGSPIIKGTACDFNISSGNSKIEVADDLTGVYTVGLNGTVSKRSAWTMTTESNEDVTSHFVAKSSSLVLRDVEVNGKHTVQLYTHHKHDGTEWNYAVLNSKTELTDGVQYVLIENLTGDLTIPEDTTVDLCLNGKTLTGKITVNGTLNLYNCKSSGGITNSSGSVIVVGENGTLNYYGGKLTGGSGANVPIYANTGGVVNLYATPTITTSLDYEIRGNSPGFLHICKKLTQPSSPLRVNFGTGNDDVNITNNKQVTVTSGWSVYMSGANPTEYFAPGKNRTAKIDTNENGELVLRLLRVTIDGKMYYPSYSTNSGKITDFPAQPTKTGYIWQGYYTAETGGTKQEISSSTVFTDDMTLYSQWEECDHSANTNTIEKTAATCATAGSEKYTCYVCGLAIENVISALEHSYSNTWTIDSDRGTHYKKCTRENCNERGSEAEHEWSDGTKTAATCSTEGSVTYKCEACTATKTETIPALGHDYSDVWLNDDTNHWHKCSRSGCNGTTTAEAHKWGAWVVTKAAEVGVKGEQTSTCEVCEKTKTQEIEALPTPEPTKYTVTYQLDKYTGGNVPTQVDTAKDGKFNLPDSGLSRTGYTLAGWALLDENGVAGNNTLTGEFTMPERDVTFVVRWTRDSSYTLKSGDIVVLEDNSVVERSNDGKTVTINQGGTGTGDTTITLPAGSDTVTVTNDVNKDKIIVPDGSTVRTGNTTVTISGGSGSVEITGAVNAPAGSSVTDGNGNEITINSGSGRIDTYGTVSFSAGEGSVTVKNGNKETTVTVPAGSEGITVTENGTPLVDNGSNGVTIVSTDGTTTTITLPENADANVGIDETNNGVSVPAGSTITTTKDGATTTTTISEGTGNVAPDGQVTLPDGGKVTIKDSEGKETTNTVEKGESVDLAHTHSWSDGWNSSGTHHWHECTAENCPVKVDSERNGYAEHDYNQSKVAEEYLKSAATCTAKAVYYKSCICGAKGTEPFEYGEADANNHDLEHHNAQAETCTEIGWNAYVTCSRCDYTTKTEIPVIGHNYGDLIAEVKATCTTTGMAAHYKCSMCNKYFDAEKAEKTLEALTIDKDSDNHADTATTWTKTATTHKETYNCCGALKTVEAAHTFGQWNNGKQTCSICSYENTCSHTGGTATCREKATCTRCGEEYGDFAGHEYGSLISEIPATHMKEGTKAHFTCSVCEKNFDKDKKELADLTIEKLAGHIYGEWTVTEGKGATCTAAGEETRSCICGAKETREIKATGHKLTETKAKAATCTEDGNNAYYTCSVCGKYFSDEEGNTKISEGSWIIAAGHNWNKEFTIDRAASCTEKGSESIHCSRCEATKDKKEIPLTEHSWDEGAVTTNPTCEKAGVRTYTCEVCRTTKTEEIAAAAHQAKKVDGTGATCTADGNRAYYTCEVCSKYFTDEACTEGIKDLEAWKKAGGKIDATGHTYGDWIIDKEATEYEKGSRHRVCSVCKYQETEAIAELGHKHTLTEVASTPATCTTGGNSAYYTCTCGKWFSDSNAQAEITDKDSIKIAALEHDWGNWTVTKQPTSSEDGEEQRVCTRDNSHIDKKAIPALTHTHTFDKNVVKEEYIVSAVTCTSPAVYYKSCECGATGTETFEYGSALDHSYEWQHDADKHWKKCTRCDAKDAEGNHIYDDDSDTACNTCGYERTVTPVEHKHTLTKVVFTPATCTSEGVKEHWKCTGCDKLFGDENGTAEITDTAIPKLAHTWNSGEITTAPTTSSEGVRTYTCTVCGATKTESVAKLPSGGGAVSKPDTGSDNVVNKAENKTAGTAATTTATIKPSAATTTADGKKTTATAVDDTTAGKIIDKAVTNKSTEVVVNTSTKEVLTEAAAGAVTEIAMPEKTVQELSQKTEASVTIKSDAAKVTLNKEAVDGLAAQAGDDGYVRLVVEIVKQESKRMEVELKLVTSKGTVTDFRGGDVSVTVKLNDTLAAEGLVCVYIDDYGTYHRVTGDKNADGTYNFITGHFSRYAIMALDDADEIIAEQTAKVKELAGKIQLKARSVKTPKGNIKVRLKITKGAASFKALEDMGYTLKYQFYRSTEMRKNYKYKFETLGAPYTNTDAKKGTRYYYKARIVVYDTEGNMVLKTNLKKCWYATRIK